MKFKKLLPQYLSLRIKFLISLTGIIVVTVLVSFAFVQNHVKIQIERSIKDGLRQTRNVFHNFQEERYGYLISQSRVIAEDPKFFASIADLDAATAYHEAVNFQQIVKADLFMVTDGKGNLLLEVGEPDKKPIEKSYLSLVRQALEGSIASGLLEKKNRIYQAVSVPVRVRGEIFASLTIGYLIDNLLAAQIKGTTNTEIIFLLDQEIVASTLPIFQNNMLKEKLFSQPSLKAPVTSLGETQEGVLNLERENFIYLYDFLGESENKSSVAFVMLKSLDQLLSPLMSNIKNFMLVIILAGILFSFILSLFISKNLTSSVRQLLEASKRVARGNYDVTIKVQSHDEMSELADSFNQMSQALKEHLEDLHKAHSELLHSERLAAVGKVAATVVHDFKNSIGIITLALESLHRKQEDDTARQKYIKMIKSEIERALDMTQDILEFSKGETRLKLSQWKLDSTLEELVNSLAAEFLQNKIRLSFISRYKGEIVADQYRLMRVFKNLLYNAKEAMTAGGEITIEISELGQEVLLKFIDNGPGIPDEIRESLFEPFVTFGKVSGTGLGLSISKKIVEEHRGRIEYESYAGRGTTFAIYLPKNLPQSAEQLSLEASLSKS